MQPCGCSQPQLLWGAAAACHLLLRRAAASEGSSRLLRCCRSPGALNAHLGPDEGGCAPQGGHAEHCQSQQQQESTWQQVDQQLGRTLQRCLHHHSGAAPSTPGAAAVAAAVTAVRSSLPRQHRPFRPLASHSSTGPNCAYGLAHAATTQGTHHHHHHLHPHNLAQQPHTDSPVSSLHVRSSPLFKRYHTPSHHQHHPSLPATPPSAWWQQHATPAAHAVRGMATARGTAEAARVDAKKLRALPFSVPRGAAEEAFRAYQRTNPFLSAPSSFDKVCGCVCAHARMCVCACVGPSSLPVRAHVTHLLHPASRAC